MTREEQVDSEFLTTPLASAEAAEHLERLDEFEGAEYERVVVPVFRPTSARVIAFGQLYAARA